MKIRKDDLGREMIDPEFIERAMKHFENEDNNKHHNDQQRIWFSTSKGMFAKRKGDFKRRSKMSEVCEELTWEEKKHIGDFYKNCPHGHEVDHIIPISKGGKHILSNLQYLTWKENRSKGAKLLNDNVKSFIPPK
jgi:hypothetical protein